MLEIRITAPELSEAINNLARALSGKSDNKMEIAATTAQRFLVPSDIPKYIAYLKENFGFSDADIQTVCGDYARANLEEEPTPNPITPAQVAAPTEAVVNPTVPVSAPQTVPTAPNTQNASYPTNATPAAPAPAVPTAAPQYTLDMIAKAGTALIDAGKMAELSALLAKYGVEALTTLDPAHYGAFAAELRAMGASI